MKKKKIDTENSLIYRSNSMCDLSEALPYIEHKGYFSDSLDFSKFYYGELNEVYVSNHHEFAFYGIGVGFKTAFKYFIPESEVVFEEEPFKDIEEFFKKTGFKLGKPIRYRKKGNDWECVVLLNGYSNNKAILLGNTFYKLKDLADAYEYYDIGTSKWKPFEVAE